MHCYCFTNVIFTVLHSFTLVSFCYIWDVIHACVMFWFWPVSYSTVSWQTLNVWNVYMPICVCVCMYHALFFKVTMTGTHMGKIRGLQFIRSNLEPNMNSNQHFIFSTLISGKWCTPRTASWTISYSHIYVLLLCGSTLLRHAKYAPNGKEVSNM